MLQIRDLTLRIGGRVLLDCATAVVSRREKVGIVGRNGIGKSTLLRLIAGELEPDGGSVELGRNLSVGMVAQHSPGGSLSPREFVLAADVERTSLQEEAASAETADRIAEIQLRLADIGAEGAPARAAAILAGLGFDEDAQQRPLDTYSGGWRMRVALATTLFLKPDLLLLDEPSNHLDLESRIWLESHLMAYQGTVLLVSHDRKFLNSVVNSIIHFESLKLNFYSGNYDRFEKERQKRIDWRAAEIRKQLERKEHMNSFVNRFRYKASKARQAQSRLKALARMSELPPLPQDNSVVFSFPDPEQVPPPLITLDNASVGYETGSPVLNRLELRLDMDDRIALLGENGNGKTTLLRLLTGELDAMSGSVHRTPKLRVGYFAQQQTRSFDPNRTAREEVGLLLPGESETRLRSRLGRFGISQERADIATSSLSGGELARLLFCCVTRDAPHVLLLDEPTNHLDMDSRQALVDAMNAYLGAVVLVTHDLHLVELCADRLWVARDGTCRPFDGDIRDYRNSVLEARRAERRRNRGRRHADGVNRSRKSARREHAHVRAMQARHRKAIAAAVRRVERLCKERASVERKLADPALYSGPVAEIARLNKHLSEIERNIDSAESEWLAAEEAASQGRFPDNAEQ